MACTALLNELMFSVYYSWSA